MDSKQAVGQVRVLVDGNNVMGSRPDGWWRDRGQAMRRLVNELAQHKWRAGGEWTIVFDGQPRQGLADAPAGVQVEYALRGGANGADDRIVEIVDQTTRSSKVPEVLVYTSDRGLRERLLPLGARVEGASALLRALRELP